MKKPSYTNIILTIIAILLALLVWEQRYFVIKENYVFNRITGKAHSFWDYFDFEHHWKNQRQRQATKADSSDFFSREILQQQSP